MLQVLAALAQPDRLRIAGAKQIPPGHPPIEPAHLPNRPSAKPTFFRRVPAGGNCNSTSLAMLYIRCNVDALALVEPGEGRREKATYVYTCSGCQLYGYSVCTSLRLLSGFLITAAQAPSFPSEPLVRLAAGKDIGHRMSEPELKPML
jgi:hypothetical protein